MYQEFERGPPWKNVCQNMETEQQNSPDHGHNVFLYERQSPPSFYAIHGSHFVDNTADSHSGVVYLYAPFINLYVEYCVFRKNYPDYRVDGIYKKNLAGTVVIQQCLFDSNFAVSNGDSLYLVGIHSEIRSCQFFGDLYPDPDGESSTVDLKYGTLSADNCTFMEQVHTSIGGFGSKLSLTDRKCYGKKQNCLNWGNSEVKIAGSQFAARAEVFLFNIHWSNLTVINSSFTNGRLVFKSHTGTDRVEFINCLFHTRAGLVLIGNTLLKNCTITDFKEPFILAVHANQVETISPDFKDSTGSAHLEIVDCVISGNIFSVQRPFIYVGNVSVTMINCLYTGNDVKNHIVLNGTTDVTITNVTFTNNSLGGEGNAGAPKSLLAVNSTILEIKNCILQRNNLQSSSLILVSGTRTMTMTMTDTIISDNFGSQYQFAITMQDLESVKFSNSKFINNTDLGVCKISSVNFFLIQNCLFKENTAEEFKLDNTYNTILQRSTFYKVNYFLFHSFTEKEQYLRIFRCNFNFFWRTSGDFFFYETRGFYEPRKGTRPKLLLLESAFKFKTRDGKIRTVWSGSQNSSKIINGLLHEFTLIEESPYASGTNHFLAYRSKSAFEDSHFVPFVLC